MFENDLIRENSLKPVIKDGVNCGFSFESRIPFYRALPLSCIESINLTVNDGPIENENITLILRGESYKLNELSGLMATWWGFTEDVTFFVKNTGAPYKGNVELDLSVKIRLPYLIPTNGEDRPNYDTSRGMKQFKMLDK